MNRLFYGRENNKWPWWFHRAEFPTLPAKASSLINHNITDSDDALFAREQLWAIMERLA